MKRLISLLIISFFVNAYIPISFAVNVENIRIGQKKNYTRLVLDLNQAPGIYNINYISEPERIIVKFTKGSVSSRALRDTSSSKIIKQINSTKLGGNEYQVVITLSTSASFKHFVLPPYGRSGHRLVIDITPGKKQKSLAKPLPKQSKPTETLIASDTPSFEKNQVTNYSSQNIDIYNKDLPGYQVENLLLPLPESTLLKDSSVDKIYERRRKTKSILEQLDTEPSAAPRFDIHGYKVKGNTILSRKTLQYLLKPFTGRQKDFGDVQRALESLETHLTKSGYGMVQVYLPEQELTSGIVLLNVIEPKIKTLSIEGASHFNLENISSSLVSLVKGSTPNTKKVAQNIALVNENPAKKTTIQFIPGSKEGELNSVINVKDKDPGSFILSLDNTGTKSTGFLRLGVTYQNANLTNNDDVFSFQYQTSEKSNALNVYGLGYHYPFYSLNSSLDLFGGLSSVDSGIISNLFTVSGKGLVLGARYNQVLAKKGNYSHRISYGFDFKKYDTDAIPLSGGGSIIPDISVKPVSVTYSGQWTKPGSATGFNLQVYYNFLAKNSDDAQFQSSRTNAKAKYSLVRYGVEHAQAFAKTWQMRFAVSGQETVSALVSGEQFGIGGNASVRGYLEREVSNDRGIQATAEVYSPDFSAKWGMTGDLRALAFYDFGHVSRNLPLASETTKTTLSSIGLGLRLSRKEALSAKLDLGLPLQNGITQKKGSVKLHASLKYAF